MSQLIERLREAHDNFAGLEGVSNDDLVAVLDAAAALTQPSPSPVAAEGYVLVPVEPTPEMCLAALKASRALPPDGSDVLPLPRGAEMWAADLVYRAMLSARPPIGETVPGAGWQPIETAPKDGQSVIGICATAYSPEANATWWFDDGWREYSRPRDKWHGGVGIWFPTHWQPLPAPLASTQEGEAP